MSKVRLLFTDHGWEDYLYSQREDRKKLKRINTLIEDVKRNGNLQGFYSRRIDLEHRLVYRMTSEQVEILQCRYHY